MSAFIVSKATSTRGLPPASPGGRPGNPGDGEPVLRWIRSFQRNHHGATPRRELTPETADQVGLMLWRENYRSYNHLYREQLEVDGYEFDELPGVVDPVTILKAIACYRYQSCEHPERSRPQRVPEVTDSGVGG